MILDKPSYPQIIDDEDDIDWNDEGTDCIHFIQKYGV